MNTYVYYFDLRCKDDNII